MQTESSLRRRSLDETWSVASGFARSLGITRVTEITALDQFDVPVFTAVRPGAEPGSLCVSAGKGRTALEARVGAVMEAIELAMAEPRRHRATISMLPARLVGGGRFTAEDLCPLHGRPIPAETPLPCMLARDLRSGDQVPVPVELVLFPVLREVRGAGIYGSGGNGLASGNDVEEATVHALAECIERDVMAFHIVRDESILVRSETLPDVERTLCAEADALGFDLVVRTCPNEFQLAHYHALLSDRSDRRATHFGAGCHPRRDIALRRAVTEAYQSRLTSIHGARDDLPDANRRVAHLSVEQIRATMGEEATRFLRADRTVSHDEVPDRGALDIAAAFELLIGEVIRITGISPLVVTLTPPEAPVAVVRVIAPRLELMLSSHPRIGPRLRQRMAGG